MKILLLTAMLAPSLLSADTWDLAKDFRTDKNPNGPWFYGFSNYGGTTLTPLPAAKDILDVPGLNGWAAETFPFVAKNTTNAALAGPDFEVAPGEVVLQPGDAPADVVTVRWVAPSDGTYDVAAAFRRLDPGAKVAPFVIKQLGKPDQEILLGGKEIPAADSLQFSDGMLVLSAQDTLDFSVSAWEDGPAHDAIGLSVRIAPTDPELLKPRMLLEYSFATDANDSSGRNLHGTLRGNPRFEAIDGRPALVLGGTGDWVEASAQLSLPDKEFTIECWVRPATTQAPYADIFGNQTSAGMGFVLQQDAARTNEYAFTYSNGAGGLISTKPVRLTADRWQHVAITKSPKDLKFHLNGVLMDSIPASAPVSVSPIALRIGLGFEDDVRCFNGSLSEFRVWNRALSEIKAECTPEQKFEALANNSKVRLSTATPGRIFNSENPPVIEVGFGDGTVAEGVIKTTFECVDQTGKHVTIPPGELSSKGGFKQTLRLPLPEGYYRLSCQPSIAGSAAENPMAPATLTFAVLGEAAAGKTAPAAMTVSLGSQPTTTLSLDGDMWKIATDPKNVGREEKWFNTPQPDAKPTKVPWIIQDVFPSYHGVAWYWREFDVAANPHENGRFILRFWAVDYLAEVWVNGVKVGQHEGAEAPFEFDVTNAVKPGGKNLLAVRVLNPTVEPIDGIGLGDTPRGIKGYPLTPGSVYNVGGIVDSVELLATPTVRVENIFAKPDWKTGQLNLDLNLRNASDKTIAGSIRVSVAPATNGETLTAILSTPDLPPGDTLVRASLQVPQHRLWDLDDPFLYRVTVTAAANGSESFDETSTRFGFRDFRFENESFRLNGKRIYLQGALILPHFPVGFRVQPGTDYLRRDLVAAKAMGLNTIRIIWGGLRARDMDLFDDLGILVQQEHYGAHRISPGPEMGRRFDESIGGVIRRDRNHPSIVIWTLLNESGIGGAAEEAPVFQHAVQSLPLVKFLDNTRFVSLNSGGFDMQFGQASTSNPGATDWQFLMGAEAPGRPGYANWWQDFGAMSGNQFAIKGDMHVYPLVPYTATEVQQMRRLGERAEGRKIVISEIGSACAVNLPRFARHYEQMGAEYAEDARYYRDKLDKFMADWEKWDLGRIWTTPEDYFTNSERNMVKLRRVAGNALRSNPFLAGHYFCALVDSDFNGVGLLNNFREFKPGVVDLQSDLTAPLRWCLFAEPASIFSGGKVKLEAILSNLDALRAGEYPVHIQVVAPDGQRVLEESLNLTIPADSIEQPFVKEVFSRDVPVSGPAGTYKFIVNFERGAVATGGEITFNVFDPAAMPPVEREVVLWGNDPGLAQWLTTQKIRFRPFDAQPPSERELILVGTGGGDLAAFRELAQRMARGSTVVFLSPSVFARDDQPLGFLPLVTKGWLAGIDVVGGYYRSDTFAPQHPVFDGLTAGGILDYTLYRNIITQGGFGLAGAPAPDDLIAAGIRAQMGYASVIHAAAYKFGEGRFIFNTLRIRENLGTDPVAELLLRNLLNDAARDLDQPLAELPADFDQQLKAIGYE